MKKFEEHNAQHDGYNYSREEPYYIVSLNDDGVKGLLEYIKNIPDDDFNNLQKDLYLAEDDFFNIQEAVLKARGKYSSVYGAGTNKINAIFKCVANLK